MNNTDRITSETIRYNLTNLSQVTFEVTDDCNLQCKYCGYGDMYCGYDKRESKYLDFNSIKPLLDYLIDIWKNSMPDSSAPITYVSFYGGEPLLNVPFIKQVIEYIEASELNRKILYSLTTNAVLLERYMDYLVQKDFHILISLDGNEDNHSYRVDKSGNNSFYRVTNNIQKLRDTYPKFFKTNVNFNSVLHNRNSVESIHEYITTEFGKIPSISELNNSGIRPEKKEEFDRTYRNKSESLRESENYAKLSQELFMNEPNTHELLLYLHKYSGNVYRDYIDLFLDPEKVYCTPSGTCTPFSKKMFITVNGKILQCERIDHCFALGNVSATGLELDLNRIACVFNNYLDKIQSKCSICYRKRSCIQCLYYIETINQDSPQCHGYMDKDAYNAYTSFCLSHLYAHPELYNRLMTEVVLE